MREYGQVQSAFWQSPDAQQWTDTGKLLALYLLTGPHANGLGCYRLPDGYVVSDLSWSAERVAKGFEELLANGFANRLEGVVFIPNFLRWNRIANGNIAKARFGEFEGLPKGEAKALAARAMLEFCSLWTEKDQTVLETVCQTVTETVCQTQKREVKTRKEPNPERTQKEPRENQTQKQPQAALPKPPEYVQAESWSGFVDMRRRERHPLTPRAAQLVIKELDKLRDAGEDPNDVLDQSTRNGWRDVFPIKRNGHGKASPTAYVPMPGEV